MSHYGDAMKDRDELLDEIVSLKAKIERATKIIEGYKRDCAIDGTSVGPGRLHTLYETLKDKE